jgi:hypothetical protein
MIFFQIQNLHVILERFQCKKKYILIITYYNHARKFKHQTQTYMKIIGKIRNINWTKKI